MSQKVAVQLGGLSKYLEASSENYKACLDCLKHDLVIDGVAVCLRFHYLKFDPNGRPKFKDLAECLADHLIEYSFSASRRGRPEKAHHYSQLRREAKKLLRKSSMSGEAGEVLLYFLQEAVLGAPQMVSKIDLKTNPNLESHGSDGLHMKWHQADQVLDIYHGEAKLEKSVSKAMSNAFESMTKFHADELDDHELRLVTSHYKWADGPLKDAVLRYVDRKQGGGDCRVNHACLIGYDWKLYKGLSGEVNQIIADFKQAYTLRAPKLRDMLARRFAASNLKQLRFEFFFMPFDSVQTFRDAFHEALA
ncbi:MAG TPA: DUF1837 domain-containing protein [Tepidisphaeraceae bacterium]|jgi:hypothetical protein|nr:DUF1837 domain-containing protein [Tepidisphaeraceae bacterium]